MSVVRVGVVEYLNARPLVFGLDTRPDLFSLRFDLPSRCASLLHEGRIDLGTLPSIEYLRGERYRVVPDIAIGCDGPVASVAIFTTVPIERIRTIALDASSRTSVVLARILCARHFGIAPAFRSMSVDPRAMLADSDAALVIGDPALLFDHAAAGAAKIDLGQAWKDYTGLPFVFALWIGREGAVTRAHVEALQEARNRAIGCPEDVAAGFFPTEPELARRATAYLRDNVRYGCSEPQILGLTRFYREAATLGLVPAVRELAFY